MPPANPLEIASDLANEFAATAAERDAAGGTPLPERAHIRASGLLTLVVPAEQGGPGGTWPVALQVVRILASADASLAHVLGYHYLGLVTPHLYGTPAQRSAAYAETLQHTLFWGNAVNPLDTRTVLDDVNGALRLNGAKSFCSGSADSDRLIVSALRQDSGRLEVLVVPTCRQGVAVLGDWDNMGQRQTDSGSVRFTDVAVQPGEILGPPGPGGSVFSTLRTTLTQLVLANVYAGIAAGAIQEAAAYTREQARAWPGSGVESASRDPYTLRTFGELWVDARAAESLADRAAELLATAWARGEALTAAERAEVAVAVATTRVAAARASLAASNRMFEVMGSRATAARYRFDRFWRNARTLTLHDPLDHKLRELGDWALNAVAPTPGFYT